MTHPWRLVTELIEALKRLGLTEEQIKRINDECCNAAQQALNEFYRNLGKWNYPYKPFCDWLRNGLPRPLLPIAPVFDPHMTDEELTEFLIKMNKYYQDLEYYLDAICNDSKNSPDGKCVNCFGGRDIAVRAFIDKLREILKNEYNIDLDDLIEQDPILKDVFTYYPEAEFWHPLWESYTYWVETEICKECLVGKLLHKLWFELK